MRHYRPLQLRTMKVSTLVVLSFSVFWLGRMVEDFKIEDDIEVSFGRVADPNDLNCAAVIDRVNGHWVLRIGETSSLGEVGETLCHEVAHILDWDVSSRCGDDHSESHALYEYELKKWWGERNTLDAPILIEVPKGGQAKVLVKGSG